MRKVTRVTFWGVDDGQSWLNNWPVRGRTNYPLLFGRDCQPKPEEKKINIPSLPLKPITIIKFPVKKYEGVYRVRTINGSPYQLYSSIFTVELTKYIQEHREINQGQVYRIGIISPYAIQSNIISNLISKTVSGPIDISTGTVHSFQGDECNLVIVVLNPPRNISRSVRTFLNKKTS